MASVLGQVKEAIRPGRQFDVTNHYISREAHPGHPWAGTTRRTIGDVNSAAFYFELPAGDNPANGRRPWPKASQVELDGDGTIRLFGGGAGQQPGDLFLTLVPVAGA
jgi:hypothetical protein